MCESCGCGDPSKPRYIIREAHLSHDHPHHDHDHYHDHDHDHDHDHQHGPVEIQVQQDILHQNQLFAERNRGYFEAKGLVVFNLVSSPGSGKTSLLEAMITRLDDAGRIAVVEGDQEGTLDADRIAKLGVPVIQINTGKSCHLDAEAVGHAVRHLEPEQGSLVFIENVGNLMCPSLFDLGENYRLVLLSTPEGEDKPLKYPNMFDTSHVCIISKTDLSEPAGFDVASAKRNALRVNPRLKIFEVSARTGEGMEDLIAWVNDIISN